MRLAIAAIALSVAVMIVTVSVVTGFKQEIQQKITGFSAPIQISGEFLNSTFENKPFEDKELTRNAVLDFDFVKHIQPYALKPGILKANEDFEGVVLKGIDGTYAVDFFSKTMVRGRFLDFSPTDQSKEVIISSALANKLAVDTGASVTVWFVQDPPLIKPLKVVGIYQTDIEEIDDHYVVTDLRIIQQVSGWETNQIGGYEVLLNEFDLDQLSDQNNDIRFAINLELNSQSIMNRFPQIFDWLGLLDKNVQIIFALMTIVAIINMITALLIMILERTQMIGILKSLGYSNVGLRRVFVYNAAYFIAYGLLIGNVLGIGLVVIQDWLQPISLSADYYVTHVPVVYAWGYFGLIDFGTLLVCSLAMYIPSALVTRIIPVKALRFN